AFYRFKVVAVDAAGLPSGAVTTLDSAVSWSRYIAVPGDIVTTATALGALPADVGGEVGLFAVPYWSNGMMWLSGQYHQVWDTTKFADGRYLLIIELFGPGGVRIKPAGAPAADPGTARPFQFRVWEAPDDTANVAFADCAHVFRISNTAVTGDIVDLRKDGNANTGECQFMSGPAATSQFSVGFRAFHADGVTTGGGLGDTNSFMAGYALTWQRGLNGPSGLIEAGSADKGENIEAESNRLDFSFMLGAFPPSTAQTRCTFSAHLHVNAKHHNGAGFIDAYDYHETASFALEITPNTPILP
ncbi:MAG: hypothetical protein ACRCUI_11695, partial [Polymorphobacter sp.]